ncbi:MAG: response regulator [Hyphomicrobium sp.]
MATIAIVNNEQSLAEVLAYSLEASGHRVRVYHRSDVALEGLIAEPADVALSDGQNPPLGGIELFRRLRKHSAMPVIFLSAWAVEIERTLSGSRLEADGYVQIPVSLVELNERIAKVCGEMR